MSTPLHIFVGITIASVLTPSGASPLEAQRLLWFSIFSANLPDLDMIYMGPKRKNHRLYSVFHFPLFWIALTPLIAFLFHTFPLPKEYALALFWGLVSHFFFDTLDTSGGIRLFAPFDHRQYSFLKKINNADTIRDIISGYFKKTVKYEAVTALICSGIVTFLRH